MIGVIHTPGPWVAEEYGVVTTHAPERAQSSRGSAHPQVAMVCIPPGIDTGDGATRRRRAGDARSAQGG
jgi:hypothetical protein